MTGSQFICKEPCPLCGSEVQVFGTDCYPEEGIGAECMNMKCSYELTVSCTVRTDCLKDVAKKAHGYMCELMKANAK